MTPVPTATVAAHLKADAILCEWLYPEPWNAITEPFNDGIQLTIKRMVQSGLSLAAERLDQFRIDGLGVVVFHDSAMISYEPIVG